MSVNKVILVGRLGVDPESRAFPNGGSVCNLRLATSNRWKDKQTGERKEATEWHRIVLRNKLGEVAQQYLKKGSQVYIEGRIQTRKWQNQSGEDQYTTEIVGNEMTMLDNNGAPEKWAEKDQQRQNTEQSSSAKTGSDYGENTGGYYEDPTPFAQHQRGAII